MPILTTTFPKYGPRMKLNQIGPAKIDLQGWKIIKNVSP